MTDKARGADGPHKGTWWCACGRTEPRPPLTPEETGILAWWRANGSRTLSCKCPKKPRTPSRHARHHGYRREEPEQNHTTECSERRATLDRFTKRASDISSELTRREKHDGRRTCQCGGVMIPVNAVPKAFAAPEPAGEPADEPADDQKATDSFA